MARVIHIRIPRLFLIKIFSWKYLKETFLWCILSSLYSRMNIIIFYLPWLCEALYGEIYKVVQK